MLIALSNPAHQPINPAHQFIKPAHCSISPAHSPLVLPTLQAQAGQQALRAEEADRQDEEGPSNLVDLQHSLVDYRAACMAVEESIVGVSCQSVEAQPKAILLPTHLALWEVKIGDTLYVVMKLQVCARP